MDSEFVRLSIHLLHLKTHATHPLIITMKTEKKKQREKEKKEQETRKEKYVEEYCQRIGKIGLGLNETPNTKPDFRSDEEAKMNLQKQIIQVQNKQEKKELPTSFRLLKIMRYLVSQKTQIPKSRLSTKLGIRMSDVNSTIQFLQEQDLIKVENFGKVYQYVESSEKLKKIIEDLE